VATVSKPKTWPFTGERPSAPVMIDTLRKGILPSSHLPGALTSPRWKPSRREGIAKDRPLVGCYCTVGYSLPPIWPENWNCSGLWTVANLDAPPPRPLPPRSIIQWHNQAIACWSRRIWFQKSGIPTTKTLGLLLNPKDRPMERRNKQISKLLRSPSVNLLHQGTRERSNRSTSSHMHFQTGGQIAVYKLYTPKTM